MTAFQTLDFIRFLVWYLAYPIVPESIEKSFEAISLGLGVFFSYIDPTSDISCRGQKYT